MWQRNLCEGLSLKGRIIISKNGINGTVGGSHKNVTMYQDAMLQHAQFQNIDFKWSDGSPDDFPKLQIRVRDEIVTFGIPDQIEVDENGVIGGGVHLQPHQVHELVAELGDDVVFFDGRNEFESRIGRFKNAVLPTIAKTTNFIAELDSGKYDYLKEKTIITYCTGGIRCEVMSSIMKNQGFKEVYQIDGGIVRYGETYGNDGLWEGSLYVFDRRLKVEFGEGAAVLGQCQSCGQPDDHFHNCDISACRKRLLKCPTCVEKSPELLCSLCI